MAWYPVVVPSVHPREFPGKEPPEWIRKYRQQIEDFMNEHKTPGPNPDILNRGEIAKGAGVHKDIVEVFLRHMGTHGMAITIYKPEEENDREA